jgi:hypothetical protein
LHGRDLVVASQRRGERRYPIEDECVHRTLEESVHGADDEQVPLVDAQSLYAASGSPDKTLRVFTAEEGGAQHCQRDYLTLGVAEMWNWFEDKLLRS